MSVPTIADSTRTVGVEEFLRRIGIDECDYLFTVKDELCERIPVELSAQLREAVALLKEDARRQAIAELMRPHFECDVTTPRGVRMFTDLADDIGSSIERMPEGDADLLTLQHFERQYGLTMDDPQWMVLASQLLQEGVEVLPRRPDGVFSSEHEEIGLTAQLWQSLQDLLPAPTPA